MKYLSDYTKEKTTNLLNECNAFFAFSTSQFKESKKDGIKYVNLQAGLICDKTKVKDYLNGLDQIYKEAIAQDIKENGLDKIIARELWNYESFYMMDYSDAIAALKGYGVTEQKVKEIFEIELTIAIEKDLI